MQESDIRKADVKEMEENKNKGEVKKDRMNFVRRNVRRHG